MLARSAATLAHTATGKAAVAVPGHSQVFILGTSFDACFDYFWSQLCAIILLFVLYYNFLPAGWFFFGRRAAFFHHFCASFGHRFGSQCWAPGCPQIQGLLMNLGFVSQFWAPDLVPKMGTQNLTIFAPDPGYVSVSF